MYSAENIQPLKYIVGDFLTYGMKGENSYNECTVLTGYQCYVTFLDGEPCKKFMSLVDWFVIKQMARYRGIVNQFGFPFTLCGAAPMPEDEVYFARLRQAEATVIAEQTVQPAPQPAPPLQPARSKRAERRWRRRQAQKVLKALY